MPLAGGGGLHCGHSVRMNVIPGGPQSHTVWSAASPARAASPPPPTHTWAREVGEGLKDPRTWGEPVPPWTFPPSLSVSCPVSVCPHSESPPHTPVCLSSPSVSALAGAGAIGPGHCPGCSWPLWLGSGPAPGQEPFCWPPADSVPALSHQAALCPASRRPPRAPHPFPKQGQLRVSPEAGGTRIRNPAGTRQC